MSYYYLNLIVFKLKKTVRLNYFTKSRSFYNYYPILFYHCVTLETNHIYTICLVTLYITYLTFDSILYN